MDSVARLGEVVRIKNQQHKFGESEIYDVCWLLENGKVVPFLFTEYELERPRERARKQKEDVVILQASPPSYEETDHLRERVQELFEENERLKSRGLLARIFDWRE